MGNLSFKKFVTRWKYEESSVGDLARDLIRDDWFPFTFDYARQEKYLESKWVFNSEIYELLKQIHSKYAEYKLIGRLPRVTVEKYIKNAWLNLDARGLYCLEMDSKKTIRALKLPCNLYHGGYCGDSVVEVGVNSGQLLKGGVQVYATYFRREFSYDFVQFDVNEKEKNWGQKPDGTRGWIDNRFAAWLFLEPRLDYRDCIGNQTTVGACCFRWRDWVDAKPSWALQWVWIHPYYRRQGILTEAWSTFLERFDPFIVEKPLSEAMQAFLGKKKVAN